MKKKEEEIQENPLVESCPSGYFWDGSKCVPHIAPPPENQDEEQETE